MVVVSGMNVVDAVMGSDVVIVGVSVVIVVVSNWVVDTGSNVVDAGYSLVAVGCEVVNILEVEMLSVVVTSNVVDITSQCSPEYSGKQRQMSNVTVITQVPPFKHSKEHVSTVVSSSDVVAIPEVVKSGELVEPVVALKTVEVVVVVVTAGQPKSNGPKAGCTPSEQHPKGEKHWLA